MSSPGFLSRLTARLTESPDDLDAVDLADRVRSTGCGRVADARRGDLVTLTGRIRTVQSGGGEDCLGVTAEVFDGTGALDVCWLGRRSLPGIDTGRFLVLTGRVGTRAGHKIMFNPRYELLEGPPGGDAEEKRGRV
ncbi:MAG TPA: OB-fold nucleic acid binding domain-containing protein [Actinomycetales bacterium]|nr:OB-fold nucleic acid binding domain-containing protein [Actinomycetales bacterium]